VHIGKGRGDSAAHLREDPRDGGERSPLLQRRGAGAAPRRPPPPLTTYRTLASPASLGSREWAVVEVPVKGTGKDGTHRPHTEPQYGIEETKERPVREKASCRCGGKVIRWVHAKRPLFLFKRSSRHTSHTALGARPREAAPHDAGAHLSPALPGMRAPHPRHQRRKMGINMFQVPGPGPGFPVGQGRKPPGAR